MVHETEENTPEIDSVEKLFFSFFNFIDLKERKKLPVARYRRIWHLDSELQVTNGVWRAHDMIE